MMKIQPKFDLSGKIFTWLSVIRFHSIRDRRGHKRRMWLCKCKCGKIVIAESSKLKNGKKKSCGCYNRYLAAKRLFTHGRTHTKEYNIWAGMKARCYNPNEPNFHRYGGRGIKVCDRWINSFENFFADMGLCPKKLSLDRFPNNDGNYEKSNCRWATKKEQSDNRCTSRIEEVDGIIMNWHEIAIHIKVCYPTYKKYRDMGYTTEGIKLLLLNRSRTSIGIGMKCILILLLVSNVVIGQDYVLNWAGVPKEPGIVNYQVQRLSNNVWLTIPNATFLPKKANDTNKYSYLLPVANNSVRIKILFTNTIIYQTPLIVINTNVAVTDALYKNQSNSDNISWTSTNESQCAFYNIEKNVSGSSTWVLVGKLSKNTSGKYVVNISKSGINRRYRLTVYYMNGIKSNPINFL